MLFKLLVKYLFIMNTFIITIKDDKSNFVIYIIPQ